MGLNMVARAVEKKHDVVAYNRSIESIKKAQDFGAIPAYSISELFSNINDLEKNSNVAKNSNSSKNSNTIWLMVPWQSVDTVISEILPFIKKGDTIIDGGNSLYTDSIRRAEELSKKGINFLDVGVSGGPTGARDGACLMIGGKKEIYNAHKGLFQDLSNGTSYKYFGKNGAGHFVKMVHNGIEYGMMQSIAEGFNLMKESDFDLNLSEVAELYNNGSVIESRLVDWLHSAYNKNSDNLNNVSGEVSHSGEAEWTVDAANKKNISVKIIEESLKFRKNSKNNPSYTGKVVSAMRGEFGGHDVADKSNISINK